MRASFRLLAAFLTFASATSVTPLAAQDLPDSGPMLEARVQTLKRSGGTAGTAAVSDLAIGGREMQWFLMAGNAQSGEMNVCSSGAADVGTLAEKLARASFVWALKVTPTKHENGSTTFDLEWARYQSDGTSRPAAEGKSTLTLREGQRRTLDLVHVSPGSRDCDNDTAVLDVAAGYKESRQLAESMLQYEVWLKHQPVAGDAIIRKFTAMGVQGADVTFAFVPLQFAVPQLASDQAAYDVFMTVQGTIKGRLQPNGRIALTVDTTRRDGLGPRGAGASGGSGNAGRKQLEVGPDEPIEIELPMPGGRSTRSATGGAIATPRGNIPSGSANQAVSIVGGRLIVENALFFQGQRTSLIVQVKPVRQ